MARFFERMIPKTYRSHYSDGSGAKHFAVWCQWFDKIWNHEDFVIKEI